MLIRGNRRDLRLQLFRIDPPAASVPTSVLFEDVGRQLPRRELYPAGFLVEPVHRREVPERPNTFQRRSSQCSCRSRSNGFYTIHGFHAINPSCLLHNL